MWKIVISSLVAIASATGLYIDYQNRKLFKTKFMQKYEIGDKKIFDGILSAIPRDIPDLTDLEDIIPNNSPLFRVDTHNKHTMIYYNYNYFFDINYEYIDDEFFTQNHDMSYFRNIRRRRSHYLPQRRLEVVDHWNIQNNIIYCNPYTKFNGIYVKFDKNSIIHYAKTIIAAINRKKKIVGKYTPNNSMVTIFGSLKTSDINQNDDIYQIEFLGTKENVLKDVAQRYYGISDSSTFFMIITFLISAGSLIFLKKDQS